MSDVITLYRKEILWGIAVIINGIWYYAYIVDVYNWTSKPHLFSWIIWTVLAGIAFSTSYADWWWAWTWVIFLSMIACMIIIYLARNQWIWYIKTSDKIAFGLSVFTIPLRYITKDPLLSVILITIIDARSFYPTFRKGYEKPYEETLSTYFLSGVKFIIAMFALGNISLITVLYPASLILMNFVFVAMLRWRRKQIPII